MSERAPREREVDASYAPTSRAHVSQPKQTPAEQAQDAIVFFARETGSARTTLEEVHEAHAANDLDRWTQTRGRVESMLVRAQRSLDRARARSSDATPDALARLAAAENELEQLRQSVGSLGEAPTGFAAVSEETEILAAFDAPLEGGFRVGFEKKEATLKARMDRLAPADRRVLAERLRKQRPNDPIAAAFSRLTEARRQGLLEHLASAGQRDAQRREVALRSKESSLVPPDGSDAPQVAGPSDATPDIRPVIAPEPESLDTKLRRILEAGDSDAAIESAFADVVADLDGTTRRALAKRLETYRPGSGDEIAARFARLDRSLRQRICTGLHTEAAPDKLPAEIRGDLESATGTSLDHVNLHADPQGNAVAAAHGARAVAIGSDIYMGEGQLDATTDVGRELIAHEVAHVVQAQSQPGLDRAAAKRDGDSTDAAEIEANAFAAEFREHRGAMTWSPQVAMNHGAALHAPSQPSKQAPRPIDAPEVYLRTHRVKLWTTVEAYLQRVNLPSPSPRLTWRDDTKFIEETVAHLRRMNLFDRRESLLEVLYPLEAYTLIAPLLPLDAVYVPTVGSALAQLFEQAIVSSLRRLGPRWVDLAEHKPEQEGINDETKSLVAAPSLITSAPIDLAVRQGLTVAAVVELASAGKHAARSKAPRTLRPVTIEWQGKSDRALWNWVRAEPSDATPEEVAAKLWGDRTRQGWDGPASYYAYGLVQTGSLFAMPPSWARGFKEASDYAPVGPTDETGSAHFLALAGSKAADDVALAQAATKKSANADSLRLVEKLEDSAIQLEYVKTQVAPWNLALDVDVGLRWVANKQAEMTTASAQERSKWAPVIDQQAERLGHIKDGVKEVAARSKGQDPNSKTSDPFRRILTAYARAAATSFMGDVSDQLIKQANNEQALLTLTALRASTNDLSLVVGSGKGVDSKQVSRAEDLASESRKIQSEILAGKQVDQERLELATLQSQELALKLRIDQIRAQLRQLLDAAAAAGKGKIATIVAAFHGKFRSLDLLGSAFDNHLQMVESSWDYEASGADSIRDPEEHALAKRQLRRGALSRAQTRFDEIKKDDGLVEFLQEGANIVDAQVKATGWASICVQLLAMIGISFVASVAGGAVARTIAGWGVRAEAIESAAILGSAARRAQRAAGWSAGVAVEAGVNTAGQAAMQGVPKDGSLFKTWLENVITGGAGSLVLSKIGHDLEFAKDIERQLHSMWARVKGGSAVALAKTVTVSSHVIVNVAIAHVAHKMVENGQQQVSQGALDEWLMQGVSIALGRYVHGTISNRRALYEKLAAIHEFHEAKHLLRQADVLLQRAATAETKPSGDYALELLASQRKLLADELAVLDAAASDPARRKALKMTESTLRAAKRFAQDQIAQMSSDDIVKLPIHVGGMQEIVDGQLRGSRAEIARTIIAAKRAHIEVSGKPDADGEWRAITIGAKSYKVHERKYDPQQWAEHAGAVDGKYKSSVKQADAIEAVKHGASTKEQRELLANEIVRQVPGVGLKIAVADGARTVISVVTPGGGRLGIKKLNDKLLGHALTDVLIAERNKVLVSVFAKHEMGVIVSGYKTMTLTSKKPPNELGTAIKDGLAEFDSLMKPKLQAVLEQGVDYWKNELATKSKRSKEYADAKERVQGLEKALADIEKGELSFSVQLGAAEIAGGKSASYEQILSAEMNASKAAIMARGEKQADGSPVQRTSGMVYSEKGFRDFAIETMKIRDDLQGKRLVWNGKPRRVFGDDGLLDTDIARAARKDQIDPQKSGDPKTLEKLKTFMERVNTLDFLSRTKSEDLADFGPQVEQAATMVTKLRKGSVIEGDAQAISQTLKGSVAQDGTASEAGFHNRAAVRKDRTVLNADILDLGVDVLQGNIKAMERIQKGGNVDAVSRGASDDIIKMKARIVKDLETFYRDEILPAAQREIVKQKRDDLAHLLDAEQQPLFLLGGDEITISVPRAFEELGLLPLLVTHLQTKARARVAITRTGATQDGARGHQRAMRQAESAHEALKSYEQLARDLSDYADKLPAAEKHQARELVVFLQTLYTSTSDGRVDVVSRTGPADVTERVKKAEKLLEKARGRD